MKKCFSLFALICLALIILPINGCGTMLDVMGAMTGSSSGSSSSASGSGSGGGSSSWVRCSRCQGTGVRRCVDVSGRCVAGTRDSYCYSCGDTGTVTCNVCYGRGEVQR